LNPPRALVVVAIVAAAAALALFVYLVVVALGDARSSERISAPAEAYVRGRVVLAAMGVLGSAALGVACIGLWNASAGDRAADHPSRVVEGVAMIVIGAALLTWALASYVSRRSAERFRLDSERSSDDGEAVP